jgi:LacI family transcriptional regulator
VSIDAPPPLPNRDLAIDADPRRPPSGTAKRVSIGAVAALAGVSSGTVSNALNHPERVREDTRERVAAAVQKLGYVRNESARHLRAGSSHTLAMLVLDAWNPFFTDMARGVEDVALDRGWTLFIANSHRDARREATYLREFAERRLAGLLVSPCIDLTETLGRLRDSGIESVVLDQCATDPDGLSVSLDDVEGGRIAVSHLLEMGHRQIGFVGNPKTVSQVHDRLRGGRIALREAGLADQIFVIAPPDLTVDGGIDASRRILALPKDRRPTALFAASDLVAIGILHELIRAGVRVPDDIAIIGYDDNAFAKQVLVPLTTVRQPAYDMGRAAAEMLLTRLEGEPVARPHLVFQPELVVRESTRVTPLHDDTRDGEA